MEPLRSTDPARIAGYRILGRLGAGGMGVVLLGRSPGGALVAIKLIRAEYADDAGFRTRFRREVAIARQVRNRWAVPVVDADTEAGAPWLATEFVPGPALSEAVGGRGAAARAQCAGARLDAGGGAGSRPRGGAGAPGREARERSAGPRRSPADRLRDRAGPGRHGPHGDGRDRRFARLPLAGAGAGAADRSAERRLLAGLCPGVRGDRRAAVRQRPGGGDALPYGP
ncbi:hypothetical protein Smic_69760 [Streptomyces microflavus]|uniref:Protein kinase domain-containing protein n=1 Tax=Streptomyces microflavus TaxID=1919 RepID=A0A7J0D103_STRMI|nr:hypothetical protein Smic_69760 [Streptomyces microflavus]